MNNIELIGFNKKIWKLKKLSINFIICFVTCFLVAFGFVIKLNPVKTDLSEIFGDPKNIIFLVVLLVIGIISLIAFLITKTKLDEYISYINQDKYEECDVCKSFKLKGSKCSFPHDNKEFIFLPFTIFAIIFVIFTVLLFLL